MRRVLLPSGGEIVMEETEALVSIDVNTEAIKAIVRMERILFFRLTSKPLGSGPTDALKLGRFGNCRFYRHEE